VGIDFKARARHLNVSFPAKLTDKFVFILPTTKNYSSKDYAEINLHLIFKILAIVVETMEIINMNINFQHQSHVE